MFKRFLLGGSSEKKFFIGPLGTRCVTYVIKEVYLSEDINTFVNLLIPIVVNLKGDQLFIEGVSKG